MTAVLAAGVVVAVPAAAKPAPAVAPSAAPAEQARHVAPGKSWSTAKLPVAKSGATTAPSGPTPPVGTVRKYLALDDYNGELYLKNYTLKAVGSNIEVWVANNTAYPSGDCRSAVPGTTTVTRAQAEYLAEQFDTVMLPKESQAFSVAPERDGSENTIPGLDSSGDGDKTVTLVDNVRDDSYYLGPVEAPTYIAGFFSSQFNDLMDRNVMTIDAYDWLHRTGANPPNEPTDDVCTSRPARPFLYEGTFAHEYQHLLQSYTDPDEVNFVNEGLSDYAISLVGYGLANRTVAQPRAESHIYCHQGFGTVETPYNPNPRACGGPEDSLTLWGDQGDDKILADYGIAWSFMLYLADHYGTGFMSTLHRDGADQGLVGIQHALDGYAPGTDVYQVVHDFQAMDLVDRFVDFGNATVTGIAKKRVTSSSLNATVNLGNPESYADAGAPANGADYVGLRAASGLYLTGQDLKKVTFSGATTLTPQALAWKIARNAPGREDNPVLWSGNASNSNVTAVTSVTVPKAEPTLTFSELHLAEEGYDYAYTVISTDGGKTYKPLANANTVPGPLGPSFNGDAEAFEEQTFDLTAYAGKKVLIGFQYVSDGGVNDGGWYVDDVEVGGTVVSNGSSLEPFDSPSEVRATPVYRWNLQLIGLDAAGRKAFVTSASGFDYTLSDSVRAKLATYPRVVAIVGYDEPTEQYQTPANYTLTVNGVVQPGGGGAAAAKAVVVKADRF
ncbi:peptidase M6 immune inhibitor A [Jatrophihabitans sp. YIM 134969]